MAKLTTSVADRGDHRSEIDTVRSTPVGASRAPA
jgi:hypothetical protein